MTEPSALQTEISPVLETKKEEKVETKCDKAEMEIPVPESIVIPVVPSPGRVLDKSSPIRVPISNKKIKASDGQAIVSPTSKESHPLSFDHSPRSPIEDLSVLRDENTDGQAALKSPSKPPSIPSGTPSPGKLKVSVLSPSGIHERARKIRESNKKSLVDNTPFIAPVLEKKVNDPLEIQEGLPEGMPARNYGDALKMTDVLQAHVANWEIPSLVDQAITKEQIKCIAYWYGVDFIGALDDLDAMKAALWKWISGEN